jgi:hypothetical protein
LCNIYMCQNCPQIKCDAKGNPIQPPDPVHVTFWEAWHVKKGKLWDLRLRDQQKAPKAPFTDIFQFKCLGSSCGFVTIKGTVRFFCKDDDPKSGRKGTKDLDKLWQRGPVYGRGDCQISPVHLPSVGGYYPQKAPSFWPKESVEGPTSHWAWFGWRCCEEIATPFGEFCTSHAAPMILWGKFQ